MIKHALKARRFYPFATRRQAASQAVKYARAMQYMAERGIEAAKLGSEFKYARATGSIL